MRIIKLTAMVLVFVFVSGMAINASDMPYNSYTYDEWGNPIESPSGYEPVAFIDGIRLQSGLLRSPTDLSAGPDGELYILDAGNGRIVVANQTLDDSWVIDSFTYNGEETTLSEPRGIFVASDNTIYIADTGNNRVLKMDTRGEIEMVITKPEEELFPQDSSFTPLKLIVDRTGSIFVICRGIYFGAVMFDYQGDFLGYFGSNRVEVTAQLLVDRFWKRILPKEQRDRLASYIPVEFTNFAIDSENFIYTVTEYTGSNYNMVRKINPMGINILENKANASYQGGFGDLGIVWHQNQAIFTRLQDISISPEGHITTLDFTRGRIFQYDQDANILFAFGGLGNQVGMFRTPVAVEHFGESICVLDRTTGGITLFELTEFGRAVHEAMELFNDGRYVEAVEPWNEVLRYNSNYNLAYIGIGKALQETGFPREAMRYFRIGAFRDGYDRAFNEYRNIVMRRVFPYIFSIIFLVIIYGYMRKTPFMQKYNMKLEKKFAKLRESIKTIRKGRSNA